MSNNAVQATEQREGWGSRFGAIMSMAGMAIGLGNVWRFPFLVGAYGGGTFVFAYLICALVIVLPLALVEGGLGKALQGGTLDAWTKILKNKTGGRIVGSVFSLGYMTMNFFYMSVTAGAIYFMYSFATDMKSKMPAEDIYNYMQSDQTTIMLVLTAVVTVAMIGILYLGIVKGVEAASKIMVPGIFLIFLIVIVFCAIAIPGIAEGYNFYLNPVWSNLASLELWKMALGQALFSVGVGPGCVLVYGSHIKKHEDITMSMTTVTVVDTAAAMLAGFAIIPTCIALGLNPESGAGLIFIVLPSALALIPFGNVMGILVMLAIFFAAFTSAMAQMEVAVTSFSDGLHWGRKKVVLGIGLLTLVMALVCVVSTSQFNFWNDFAGNYVFIVTAGLGAVGYNYVYGTKRVREEAMNVGSDVKIGAWFDPYVKFFAAPLMIIMMLNSLVPIF